VFAGNPYFIDLDFLNEEGLLEKGEYQSLKWETVPGKVNYELQYALRIPVLKKAFQRFQRNIPDSYHSFKKEHAGWLEDYSFFMSLKYHFDGRDWSLWNEDIKQRTLAAINHYQQLLKPEIEFWSFVQFKFHKQWFLLKSYANAEGIQIVGDMAIYVAYDSSDVWANSGMFQLDDKKTSIEVAGVPGDAFTVEGQLWGNPLYDWDLMKRTGYKWWIDRVYFAKMMYDMIRIDHFRGFESYYAVPYGAKNAIHGIWKKGPDIDLFTAIKEKLGDVNIIAEDLGFLTEEVKLMLKLSGYPGMKIVQFGFDSTEANEYSPHNYHKNCIVYTGTHDNDTAEGWFSKMKPENKEYAYHYLNVTDENHRSWDLVRAAWASVADIAICQMQDVLGLGSQARMNIPSTVGTNWLWRMDKSSTTDELTEQIRQLTKVYDR
jgi:4-alpha-glucanotransferase